MKLRLTSDRTWFDDELHHEVGNHIVLEEIKSLRTQLAAAEKERDEARDAARWLYDHRGDWDGPEIAPEACWPWLVEETERKGSILSGLKVTKCEKCGGLVMVLQHPPGLCNCMAEFTTDTMYTELPPDVQ